MNRPKFECSFCHAKFVRESNFIKHYCKRMQRDDELKTPIGQAGWLYYQEWMKIYRRRPPTSRAYKESKYYTAFIKFAKFVKQVQLPDIKSFVWLMKEKSIDPTLWTNDKVYAMYIEFLDRKGDPLTQTEITITTLFDIAEAANCPVSDVFSVLLTSEVIQLLRRRKISPWVLLNSKKFLTFLVTSATPEEQIIIESIIRTDYWREKFKNNAEVVKTIRKYVAEMNI